MLFTFGILGAGLAWLLAGYALLAALLAIFQIRGDWLESARRAVIQTFLWSTLALLALMILLIVDDFDIRFVATVSERSMPFYLKLTAVWGGQAGSLLFWSWMMAGCAALVIWKQKDLDLELLPWVIAIIMATLLFFLTLVVWVENPFARIWQDLSGNQITAVFAPAGAVAVHPVNGQGMNPLLRHPGMIIHPPFLYIGFIAYVIPFAFGLASLITRRVDDDWVEQMRVWSLVAWVFLTLGLLLGARWAYDVLGWGGYWGWDPVEIAALMPWLTGTAYLHAAMVQRKRGVFRRWSLVLIALTYGLVIFGTFISRSGVLSSVHSFADHGVGSVFLVFIVLFLLLTLGVFFLRWPDIHGDEVLWGVSVSHTKKKTSPWLSREVFTLVTNLLFLGILLVCFWGVIFPIVSEFVTAQKVTIGPEYYERATGPLWLGLLILVGLCPLVVFGGSTARALGKRVWQPVLLGGLLTIGFYAAGIRHAGALLGLALTLSVISIILSDFIRAVAALYTKQSDSLPVVIIRLLSRQHRRYGAAIVHIGMAVMAMGILGIELLQQDTQQTLYAGEVLTIGDYTIRLDGLEQYDHADGRLISVADVAVFDGERYLGQYAPQREYYPRWQQSLTVPAQRATLADDLYIRLVSWGETLEEGVTLKVYLNPLFNLLWLGGVIFVLGTLLAVWPAHEKPGSIRQAAEELLEVPA